MADPTRNRLRTMLGDLLDHMEGAQEVASEIIQKYPEYEAISNATEMVAMARTRSPWSTRERRLMEVVSP